MPKKMLHQTLDMMEKASGVFLSVRHDRARDASELSGEEVWSVQSCTHLRYLVSEGVRSSLCHINCSAHSTMGFRLLLIFP